MDSQTRDYQRVEEALRYLEQNKHSQPKLEEVAKHLGLTEHHFQKLFSRWVGISPKKFLQVITKEHAKQLLVESNSVLDTSLALGLSSPSRLHDLFVECDAVTPGDYAYEGKGLTIHYGFCPSPFGLCFAATTERGICHLSFLNPEDKNASIEALSFEWPQATLKENKKEITKLAETIFSWQAVEKPLYVLLKGTNFQVKVWEALIKIPPGSLVNYKSVANHIQQPSASRAVGSAIGKNNISFLIPCHRVIQQSGEFGQYRWGSERKKLMIAYEAAKK